MKSRINIILFILFILLSNIISEAQWIQQQSGVTTPLYDIEFINRSTGWSCGEGGTIIKTTNGGTNWIRQITNVPSKPLFGIHPVNENVVYSVGWFGTILKTTNGGDNWLAIQNGAVGDGNYFCVFFLNEMTGWISVNIMSHGEVKKTTDGGLSFISSYTFGWPRDMYFKDSLNGVGVDGAATIHKTTDGGSNWQSFQIAGSGNFNRVSFVNENTGYVVGEYSYRVYRTTNFGTDWTQISIVPDVVEALYSIDFSSDSIGWIGGNYSRLYKSTNSGINWKRENITTGYITEISSFSDSILWTCGTGGRIWHTTNGGEPLVNILTQSSGIPANFIVKQNFPNPFNLQTNIEFDISESSKYTLEIFNSLGQKIEVLFDEIAKPGKYRYLFIADKLSSGIYFYRLSSERFSETKKLILLK